MPFASDDAHDKLQEFINCRTDANTSFEIPLLKLNGLEDGKAVGLDDIPPKLLRLSASAISQPLTYILNQSIKTTIFLMNGRQQRLSHCIKRTAHNLGKTLDLFLCYLLYQSC